MTTCAVRDGDAWVVNGQKVWTSNAHMARWGILLARTDPDAVKHAGLSYFLCDLSRPGVDVRPLRQITGEAEFNEVFLTGVRIADDCRLGDEGAGWKIATATLNNERVFIGADVPRKSGMIGVLAAAWRENPAARSADLHARLMRPWVDAEATRIGGERLRQRLATGQPGPEGAVMKLNFARIAQEASGLELELLGDEGLRFSDWTMKRPDHVGFTGRDADYRYCARKATPSRAGRRRSCAT